MSYNEVKTINGRAVRDDTARDLIEDVEDTLREEIANSAGGAEILWEGSASSGTTLTLSDDPANYSLIEVVATASGANITGAKLFGGITDSDYYGQSISASAMAWGSGGFTYVFTTSITKSGNGNSWRINEAKAYILNNSGSSPQSCTITKIIGHK